MKINIFYDPRQTAASNSSFSPSAEKPAKVVDSWKQKGLSLNFCDFKKAPKSDLYKVHDKKYVDGILSGKIQNGFGNTNPDVAKALPWVAGSFVSACGFSLKTGESSFSPTSGAHHAFWAEARAYCTFNFLILGAIKAIEQGAEKVTLIDFDMHPSDGCREIARHLNLKELDIYSFGELGIDSTKAVDSWLKALPPELLSRFDGSDLILYNAGVDPHVDDELGGVMTTEQMKTRDRYVYETAKMFNVPIVTSLAGGYARDKQGTIAPVIKLHDQTLLTFAEVFGINRITNVQTPDSKEALEQGYEDLKTLFQHGDDPEEIRIGCYMTLERNPSAHQFWYLASQAAQKQGLADDARKDINYALQGDTLNLSYNYQLFNVLIQLGQTDMIPRRIHWLWEHLSQDAKFELAEYISLAIKTGLISKFELINDVLVTVLKVQNRKAS